MKKLLQALLACVLFTSGNAQLVNCNVEYPTTKVILNAAIQTMETGKTYKIKYPDVLTYLSRNEFIFIGNLYVRTNAKVVKKNEEADLTFNIIAPGISGIERQTAVQRSSGYVLPYKYSFPLKVEVVNKENKIVKTIVVNTDEQRFVDDYHSTYLLPAQDFREMNAVVPFVDTKTTYRMADSLDAKIRVKMERIAWYIALARLNDLLNVAYGEYKVPNAFIVMYSIDRKVAGNYPELASMIERQKVALDKFGDKAGQQGPKEELLKVVAFYQNYLTQNPKEDRNLQALMYYNGAICKLLNGETQQSKELFTTFQNYMIRKKDLMEESYNKYYSLYLLHDELANSADIIHPITQIIN